MNLPFEYTHKTNKRSKSLKIKIEQGGKVVVVSPKFVPKFVVQQFVKKHKQWIINALKKTNRGDKFESETHIFVFGKKYQKEIIFSTTQKTGIYVKGDKLIFNPLTLPKIITPKQKQTWDKKFKQKTAEFLKNTAGHYIVKRTHELAKKMSLDFNNITLRKQKTRWGSCSSQRNLNFNWKLVHFDTDIIDYVIIHELSHLVQMNHSKNFWDLVKKYDRSYLKHRNWLKKNGLSLD
jgi:predicted metal-dependent hydrolase